MKLGTKLFCCIVGCFSLVFLAGGYFLLSRFYEAAMRREIEVALEQYQSNKFVLQAGMLAWGEEETGYEREELARNMGGTAAFLTPGGETLFSQFPGEADLTDLTGLAREGEVVYLFRSLGGRTYLLTAGLVGRGERQICLVTGADMERVLERQERMRALFGGVYGTVAVLGALLSFGLSAWIVRPIRQLTGAAREMAGGNYGERIPLRGGDEVGQLAEAFNGLARAVEEQMEALFRQAREKEDFVANFAHELKTPLTSVIGYADRIYQKELPRPEQRTAARYIWNEGMRLEALALKLTDLSSLERGSFSFQTLDGPEMIRELAGDVSYLVKERGAALEWEAGPGYVRVEYDLFKTLFYNLVDNALKAGAGRIRVRGEEKQEAGYRISLEDDGCGIPQEELSRIKEAFYMVDKSRSRRQHGAGIGLALAERIALLHGTTLEFESRLGEGTRVSLYLDGGEEKS